MVGNYKSDQQSNGSYLHQAADDNVPSYFCSLFLLCISFILTLWASYFPHQQQVFLELTNHLYKELESSGEVTPRWLCTMRLWRKILDVTCATETLDCIISSSNPSSGNLVGILSNEGSLVFGREQSLEYAELQSFLLHLKETLSVTIFNLCGFLIVHVGLFCTYHQKKDNISLWRAIHSSAKPIRFRK